MTETTPLRDYGGPYVTMALFCEKALAEADGVVSLIRVVDRFTVPRYEPEGAVQPQPPQQIILAVCFKAGRARGRQTLKIKGRAPSERKIEFPDTDILFEGENRGVNVLATMTLPTEEEGVYWFDVFVGDHFMTSIPLQIIYQIMRISPEP